MSSNSFLVGIAPYQAVSEKWSKVLLKNLSKVGVFKHIAVDHSSELSDNSDAIHLRIVDDSQITVTNYYTRSSTPGTPGVQGAINYTDAKMDDIILELTETPTAAIKFEDYALKTADVNFQAKIIERARYHIAEWIDKFIMKTILTTPGINQLTGFNATTAASGDVYDLLLQFAAVLKTAGAVPVSNPSDLFGDRGMNERGYLCVNPDVMRYILKEPAFVKVDMTDKNGLWKDGVIRGTIAGLIILESSTMETNGGIVEVFGGIKSATHFAIKKVSDRMMPAEKTFEMLWSVLMACGCVVSHPKAIVSCKITV